MPVRTLHALAYNDCLPDDQEALIERYLGVRAFPTYILLDPQGHIIDRNAPAPKDKEQLIKSINDAIGLKSVN